MNEEIDMSIEELRACIFFLSAWRYVSDGKRYRERALELLPVDKWEYIPPEILEEMSRRVYRSMMGEDTFEWMDRAEPGYRATLDNLSEFRGLPAVENRSSNDELREALRNAKGEGVSEEILRFVEEIRSK